MNVFIPEKPTVKVFVDPNGKMVAKTNILATLDVEAVPVLNLDELDNQKDGLPFVVGVNNGLVAN